MRGKPLVFICSIACIRITPADAGKTSQVLEPQFDNQDHPRGCGENPFHNIIFLSNQGSPPRMRGKLLRRVKALLLPRITPADAGKTKFCFIVILNRWDHPRGCGENQSSKRFYALIDGSPPRMRGKLEGVVLIGQNLRITPADAGKT